VSLNKEPGLLHAFTSRILDVRYQSILKQLLDNDEPSAATMNTLNNKGLSPFLAYLDQFCSTYVSLRGNALALINWQAAKHGDDPGLFEIDNPALFRKLPQAHRAHFGAAGFGRAPRAIAATRPAMGKGFGFSS
jgi:hypothetical protein